ncbi:BNR-4 repeat-containing protein [Rhizobium sophoriradicis]|uniref:Uncharacterized protein n=1 Tax=Rhizobium sophoriradicis TaxID=1535245 RepID=A0A2A5KW69_9HYPH|nr:BNR-4 repeat-containing protein [Rhizobium sophoriradicis]PCK81225.1 hypothetical protein CPT34_11110 [Rhizobium sophoriradicis]
MSLMLGLSLSINNQLGGGGGGVVPHDDWFANDGCAYPWYGYATYPPVLYDATTNTVLATYQAWNGADPRLTNAARIDMSTHVRTVTLAGNNNIVDDAHGVPSICVDHQGWSHIFYGPHNGQFSLSSTDQVVTASGAFTWSEKANLISTEKTYPHPVPLGDKIYLFGRRRNVGATKMPLALTIGTPSAGAISWATQRDVVDLGTGSRVYLGYVKVQGTKIHLTVTMADYNDTFRRDLYHFIYDSATDSISNLDGSVTVAAGSFPVTITQANASFRTLDQSAPYNTSPATIITDAGVVYQVYNLTDTGTGLTTDHYRVYTPGSGWSSTDNLGNVLAGVTGSLYLNADGSLDYYYVRDPGDLWGIGGNIYRKVRSSGGVWGSEELIRAATDFALHGLSPVYQGNANCKVAFAEHTQSEATESGALKMFVYGDGGFA